jgi:putative ABC transport system permease protein
MRCGIFFDLSLRSIRLNFLRSSLASIGIVIGVLSIATMGLLGANMEMVIRGQVDSNTSELLITPDMPTGSYGMPSYITDSDLKKIQHAAGENSAIPLHISEAWLEIKGKRVKGTVYGAQIKDIPAIVKVSRGHVIIGETEVLAGQNFGDNLKISPGTNVKLVRGDPSLDADAVRVSGILQKQGFSLIMNADNALIFGESAYVKRFGGDGQYSAVVVNIKDAKTLDRVKSNIDKTMNHAVKRVRIVDPRTLIETLNKIVSLVTAFIVSVGGISLVVAAISIFNVMMISVNERVQEIGILRSIGTQSGEVLILFLFESLIIGSIGTVIDGSWLRL